MFFNALAKTKKGAVVCVFETTDSIQHMFWRYLDKAHPALRAAAAELSPQVIEDLYVRMDAFIGRVMDKLDPKTALVVMSDHGFKSFRRGVNLNSWLFVNGYLTLKEGKRTSGEWFKDVDWSRTKAYAMGLGGLYLNLKGREANGIVAPGEESRALKEDLRVKLTGLRDDSAGEVAITEAYDRDKVYAGPYAGNAPDLIIGYNQGFRASWDSVTGKVDSTIFEDNIKAWSGDHCIDPRHVPGVFFCNRKLATKAPSIMDVAPTVLTLFGLPVPAYMDGRPLISPAAPGETPPRKKGQKK
jgi:predicted AlkP superfamily phosphohydrolase/phosphomutase